MFPAGSDVEEVAHALDGIRAQGRRVPMRVLRTKAEADKLIGVVDSLAKVFSHEVQSSLSRAGLPLSADAVALLSNASTSGSRAAAEAEAAEPSSTH
jgi:hypothetical protein